MTTTAAITEYIDTHRDEMLRELEALVNTWSGTYMPEGTSAASSFAASILKDLGASTEFLDAKGFGKHVLATIGPSNTKTTFVVGHLDTVFEDDDNWSFTQDGELAYGPGVIDMKSGVLIFLWALRAVQNTTGLTHQYKILFNTDEEPGSPDSRQFIPDLAAGAEYALVMEPAEPTGEILEGRKGVGIFHFEITGVSAHAGQEPEKGASAIDAAATLIAALNDVADKNLGTTINVGEIEGGIAPYAVAARCRLGVDTRAMTINEAERVHKEFEVIATRLSVAPIIIELSGQFHRPPMAATAEVNHLITRYIDGAKTLGLSVSSAISGAASDGNTLAGAGIPVLDGLGAVGGRAHSREEYMELESYFERAKALALFMINSA